MGRYYNEFQLLPSLAKIEFISAFTHVPELSNEKQKYWKLNLYKNLISTYSNLKEPDTLLIYAHKANALSPDTYTLNALSYYHLNYSKNKDSAFYYLTKTQKTLRQDKN